MDLVVMKPYTISRYSLAFVIVVAVSFLIGSTESSWSSGKQPGLIHQSFPQFLLQQEQRPTVRVLGKRTTTRPSPKLQYYAFASRSSEEHAVSKMDPSSSSSDDELVKGIEAASSNFWSSPIAPKKEEVAKLPCVPTMDAQGLLPPGAYIMSGGTIGGSSSSSVCRVSLAIDLQSTRRKDDEVDPAQVVQQMQSYVEDGLTSFQLEAALSPKPLVTMAEEQIYSRFLRDTPGSVVRLSHLTVPLHLPSDPDTRVDYRYIRAAIAGSMHRMGSPEAIDCVQLHYRKDSRYHVEAMDALHELTREGLIQSFSGRKLPSSLLRAAASFGFSNIRSNQMDLNLVNTSALSMDRSLLAKDYTAVPLQATAPLLSGFLSDKYTGRRDWIPMSSELSENAQWHLRNTLPLWAAAGASGRGHQGSGSSSSNTVVGAWTQFQREFLPVLDEIARKHRVPVSSVAIRWLLQLDAVESVVVATTLGGSGEDLFHHRYRRPLSRKQQFRDVFRFELDEDDMESLWGLSGGQLQQPEANIRFLDSDDNDDNEESSMEYEEKSGGLYIPRR